MLQASQLRPSQGQLSTIAGGSAGKRVHCTPQALPVYNELVSLAQKGNYWAGLIVRGIKGLTSGRLDKNNIYIQQANNLAYGRGVFYVVLPGVTATIEDRSNGTFVLTFLTADTNYLQMQKDKQKPGLWKMGKNPKLPPEFQANGRIKNEKDRIVVIGDRAQDDPHKVAIEASKDLVKTESSIKKLVNREGFDLHHTPGKEGGVLGLKKAKHALSTNNDKAIMESATLLANTMYQARNIEGVLWFSDWGGSAVLTRALQILNHKNQVKLEKHSIYLNRPTSNSSETLKLADTLKMEYLGKGKNTGFRPSEIIGNHLHADITSKGAWNTGGFGVSATTSAIGIHGFATMGAAASGFAIANAALGFAGALYFVPKAITTGMKVFKGKGYK